MHATDKDIEDVASQIGRTPKGDFEVVVRDEFGMPVVIRNAAWMRDGTPMPTLYWLTSPRLVHDIGVIESCGGVDAAEAEIDPQLLEAAHRRYEQERKAMGGRPAGAPEPSGGVGGTRTGVKCLHAHYAYFLAGGDDPVGEWVREKLSEL